MGWREFWDTSPSYSEVGVITLAALEDLKALDLDVRDDAYLQAGIATNHGNHAPQHLKKAAARYAPAPVRRTTGLLATPPTAPPLDLSDF